MIIDFTTANKHPQCDKVDDCGLNARMNTSSHSNTLGIDEYSNEDTDHSMCSEGSDIRQRRRDDRSRSRSASRPHKRYNRDRSDYGCSRSSRNNETINQQRDLLRNLVEISSLKSDVESYKREELVNKLLRVIGK